MNEIRLVERLLLLCRLLLLFISVMVLAQLYYDERAQVNYENNTLVTKDWLNHATKDELSQLSLKAKQDSVYLMSVQSKRLSHNEILVWQEKIGKEPVSVEHQNTWLRVKQYLRTVPKDVSVTVYSTNRLSQFVGDKVYLPSNILWKIKDLSDIQLAETLDSLRSQKISVLIIGDENNTKEVKYLKVALSIIKETKLKNLTFIYQSYHDRTSQLSLLNEESTKLKPVQITESEEWIFYLSSEPISTSILAKIGKGKKLITDSNHINSSNATQFINWKEQVTQLQFPQNLLSVILDQSIENYQLQQQLTEEQITSQLAIKEKISSQTNLLNHQFKDSEINRLLIYLLIILWIVERLLSEVKRTRGIAKINNATYSTNLQKGIND
jgi:hypothetical protein